MLRAFTAQGGYEDDGHGSPRTWLTWQTRVTRPAASAALASMRRLGEHPAVAGALAGGVISVSWARQVCDWTGLLPEDCRGDADVILLAAAGGGADLAALAELAEEIRRRTARPDRDDGGGFADRALRLATTLGGAGRLHGDLTASAAAALQAIFDTLGKRRGPEDIRTPGQRHHDAIEEGWLRLLASGGARPGRSAGPAPALHLGLADLLNGTGTGTGAGRAAGTPDPAGPAPARRRDPGRGCRFRRPVPGMTATPRSRPS